MEMNIGCGGQWKGLHENGDRKIGKRQGLAKTKDA